MTTRPTRLARVGSAVACTLALTAGGTVVAASGGSAEAATRPAMKVPFPCGQEWRGAAYSGHNPANAVDFNQGGGDDDFGRPVKASAAGTVKAVRYYAPSPGDSTYGYTVEISHGGGWTSFYAHLQKGSIKVSAGDSVSASTTIANVGKSGDQPTSHLHYEQRLNGNDQTVVVGGRSIPNPTNGYYTRPC